MLRDPVGYLKKKRTPGYGGRVVEWLQFFGRFIGDFIGTLAWITSFAGVVIDGLLLMLFQNKTTTVADGSQSNQYSLVNLLRTVGVWFKQVFVVTGIGVGVIFGIVPALALALFSKDSQLSHIPSGYYTGKDGSVIELWDLASSPENASKLFFGRQYERHRGKMLILGLFLAITGIALGVLALKIALFFMGSWIVSGIGLAVAAFLHIGKLREWFAKKADGEEVESLDKIVIQEVSDKAKVVVEAGQQAAADISHQLQTRVQVSVQEAVTSSMNTLPLPSFGQAASSHSKGVSNAAAGEGESPRADDDGKKTKPSKGTKK